MAFFSYWCFFYGSTYFWCQYGASASTNWFSLFPYLSITSFIAACSGNGRLVASNLVISCPANPYRCEFRFLSTNVISGFYYFRPDSGHADRYGYGANG